MMSSKVLVAPNYRGKVEKYYLPGAAIQSGEDTDRQKNLVPGVTESRPVSTIMINVGLVQAALGSLLAQHVHVVKPLIMPDEHREAISIRMSESESTHDRYD